MVEYRMKQKLSSSDSVQSRVIADLSRDIIRKMCHQKLAPLSTRPWDSYVSAAEDGDVAFCAEDRGGGEWDILDRGMGHTCL